jgi:molybdate-binding protein
LADAGVEAEAVKIAGRPARSESEIATAVREGKADAGLGIEAVAHEQGLDFVPLQWERFDLVVRHSEYFEPALQKLLSLTRTKEFRNQAALLKGYDIANTGAVIFNVRR